MDRPTAHRSLPGRLGAALSAQGSRSNLWGRISTASTGNADRRSDHSAAIALPKSIRRTRNWLNSQGVSRSSDHHRRRPLAPGLARLLRLLSQLSPASGIGEELADSARGRRAGERQGHLNSTSRRFASLLPTSRLTLAIRLAPGDIDQINGETASAGRDSCESLQTYAPST